MQIAQLTDFGGTPILAPSGVPKGGLPVLVDIMRNGLILILTIAAVLALFFLISGGIRWSASGGDKTALETARKQIIFSIVGLVVAFSAFLVLAIMGSLFHVELFK